MDGKRHSGFDRRTFLGLTAGVAAGVAAGVQAGGLLRRGVRAIDATPRPRRGAESFVVASCRQCPGGCGVRVRCIGGRPVKIDGNPLHPVSGGRLCPKGQAMLQSLFHPDRFAGPLRRVGPKGSLDSFQPVAWDEALDFIARRLLLLRQQGRPESLALLRGAIHGVGGRLLTRFMQSIGSPNDVAITRGDDAATMALLLTQGVSAVPVYDLQSAEYVLAFGGAQLETPASPVHMMRAYGRFRDSAAGRRGKLVLVGPRQSITGTVADEWIPIHPGSEAIFALGVASVLVSEELYDKEFVVRSGEQFEDSPNPENHHAEIGLRTLLRRDYTLDRVASETGVSVHTILGVARAFAAARPGLAIGPRLGPLLPGRLFDHLAVHVLNALVGNIDAPGGVLVPEAVPLRPWPELPSDPIADAGRRTPRLDGAGHGQRTLMSSDAEGLAEAILAAEHSPVEAVLIADADPAFASLAPEMFRAALERVPLVISLASLPDDSSLFADWILPQSHPLECSDLSTSPPGVSFPLVSHAAAVLDRPMRDTRSLGDIVLQLVRRIGDPVATAFPWADIPTLLEQEARGLHESRRGAVIGTPFDEAWVKMMEGAGWWAPGYRSEDELWTRIREAGGWWDPLYDHGQWSRVLRTPSGRFQFCPRELEQLDAQRGTRSDLLAIDRPSSAAPERALALTLFEPLPVAGGTGAELPFLQAVIDPSHEQGWRTWVEVHPQTALALQIEHGSLVRVASSQGSIRARVQVTERVLPGVAAIPVGLGKRAGGRWARGIGANPLRLLGAVRESLGGLPDPGATRVQLLPEEV